MTNAQGLALVRAVHTAIYVVMVAAILAVLVAGLTGAHGAWLWVAAALVVLESVVFAGNGLKCPLTKVALKYGAGEGELFDTFLPERLTRHTFRVFGPLVVLEFALVAARVLWLGWGPVWP